MEFINKQRNELIRYYHPDKTVGSEKEKELLTVKFIEIYAAFETIKNFRKHLEREAIKNETSNQSSNESKSPLPIQDMSPNLNNVFIENI